MWVSTVRSVSHSRRAIPTLVRPSAISASTSRSRAVSEASGPAGAVHADQPRHHLRVERRPAGGHPSQCVEKVIDVEDAVLEQVAEPSTGHQLDRVPGLDVLRQQHDAELGVLGADGPRRPSAIVGQIGRHPHVDDGQVGCGASTAATNDGASTALATIS